MITKYRKKPIVVEATQWFKNGDHPEDNSGINNWEGKVVRFYRYPPTDGQVVCTKCGDVMRNHGRIYTLEGGYMVCPGDWIITGIKGEYYPCKPDIFEETYELVEMKSASSDLFVDEYNADGGVSLRLNFLCKPTIYYDGDQWCVLFGCNIQDGTVGFGGTPNDAVADFNRNMNNRTLEEDE